MFPLLKKTGSHMQLFNKSNNRATQMRRAGLVKLTQSEKIFMPMKIARNYAKGANISCQ